MSLLLDHDTYLDLIRGRRHVKAHAQTQAGNFSLCAITIYTVEAWLVRSRRSTPQMMAGYQQWLGRVSVLPVTEAIAEESVRLLQHIPRTRPIPALIPVMLAATALVHSLTLVTHETALYSVFPGLITEDWTIP